MGCGKSKEYKVHLPNGRVWRRNRRHLCPVSSLSGESFPQFPVESPVNKFPCIPRRSPQMRKNESAQDIIISMKGRGGVDM